MNNKKTLWIFILFFVIAMLFWRLRVLWFYSGGDVSFLRRITGLTIHHYHYGVIFVLIAGLLLMFYKKNVFSVGLMGFGLGSVLDSVISGLVKTNTVRCIELVRYNGTFDLTILLFIIVIMLSVVFYLFGKNIKREVP